MKKTRACPKCKSKDIYYLNSVADQSYGGSVKMNLGLKANLLQDRQGGEIEAYVCRDCGYIEMYLKQPDLLDVSNFAQKTDSQK